MAPAQGFGHFTSVCHRPNGRRRENEYSCCSSSATTSITLAWTAPSHDALTSYRIWRGATADSMTVLVQDTAGVATSYRDATTETDNTYVYAVTALSMDGDSPRSTTMSITRAAKHGASIAIRFRPLKRERLPSIAGGSGKEGDNDAIDFTVTLDEAASATVSVDYETSDGSAESGADYTAFIRDVRPVLHRFRQLVRRFRYSDSAAVSPESNHGNGGFCNSLIRPKW